MVEFFVAVIYIIWLILRVLCYIVVAFVGGLAGLVTGAYAAIIAFSAAVGENIDFSQHAIRREDEEPARTPYYFGVGYLQLFRSVRDGFLNSRENALTVIGDKNVGVFESDFLDCCSSTWFYSSSALTYVSSYVFEAALCLFFGAAFFTALSVAAFSALILIAITWTIDRVYLAVKRIGPVCTSCHTVHTIPCFVCPVCDARHYKLYPNRYGVWHHRCICGNSMASAFFCGRSELRSICPHDDCGAEILSSDSRPFSLQLVGGVNSGKSAYLAALFHEILFKIAGENHDLDITVPNSFRSYFNELETWYSGEKRPPATSDEDAQMYPVFIDGGEFDVQRQFLVYDISGEIYKNLETWGDAYQAQFSYCSGVLFILDPLSTGVLRKKFEESDLDLHDFSDDDPVRVVDSLTQFLMVGRQAKAGQRLDVPIAVIIDKCDVREVSESLASASSNELLTVDGDVPFMMSGESGRCRSFLLRNGFDRTVKQLEAVFTNICYFSASAIGHSFDSTCFSPINVMEPVRWIAGSEDERLFRALFNPERIDL